MFPGCFGEGVYSMDGMSLNGLGAGGLGSFGCCLTGWLAVILLGCSRLGLGLSCSSEAGTEVMVTFATPFANISIELAAARLRSMILLGVKGPRSLIRTATDLPLSLLVTRTTVPKGSDMCAAVNLSLSYRSPEAVVRP